jgi:hypothetical protein
MSAPIAAERQNTANKPLAILQQTLARTRRIDVLAERLAMHIESLVPRGRARCLDLGFGDPVLADAVRERAPRTAWRCLDVRSAPAELRAHDGRPVPFDEREYDIALLCDVLHHSADGAELLAAAGRLARRVLVKGHFEYGSYSRTVLRLIDFVDRHGEGVGVPEHYFTREAFTRLATEQGFIITALDCGLSLYEHVPVARKVLRPDCDFIAVLRHRGK